MRQEIANISEESCFWWDLGLFESLFKNFHDEKKIDFPSYRELSISLFKIQVLHIDILSKLSNKALKVHS